MKKSLLSIAIASVMVANSGQLLAAQDEHEYAMDADHYQAMGIGAVTGALIAGPAGLVIGGLVGSIYSQPGSQQESENELQLSSIDSEPDPETVAVEQMIKEQEKHKEFTAQVATYEKPDTEVVGNEMDDNESTQPEAVMVASTSDQHSFNYARQQEESNRIKEIITYDLSMDLYFKPGSVNFEPFYAQQLAGILNLMEAMPELQLNLDGYSDRQGSQADNVQLSTERLDSVRDYFVSKGVDVDRISLQAHGEKNFQSQPGDLDSYIFDRRVVVSFDISPNSSTSAVAAISPDSSGSPYSFGSFGSIGSSRSSFTPTIQ